MTDGPHPTAAHLDASAPSHRVPTFLAFAFVACVAAINLSGIGLLNPDEGRYVEVAREMIATGDYVVPRIDGHEHWTKPPGAYWAVAACLRATDLTPWSARIPAFCAALIAAAALFLLVRKIGGGQAAVAAVVVHATMLEPFALYRMATPDALQSACVVTAIAAGFCGRDAAAAGFRGRAAGLRLLAYVALGVSFVIKGPIALLIYAAVWTADFLPKGRRSVTAATIGRLAVRAAVCLAVVAAIGLPWFVVVASRRPELIDYYLNNEVAGRYFTDQHNRSQPFWFFLPVVLGGLLPWTAPALAALVSAVRRRGPFGDMTTRERDGARFLVAWLLGVLVLFSIGRSKLVTYILPLLPAAAALVGIAATRLLRTETPAAGRRTAVIVYGSIGALGVGVAAAVRLRNAAPDSVVLATAALSAVIATFGMIAANRLPLFRRIVTLATVAALSLHGCLTVVARHEDTLGINGDFAWLKDVFDAEKFTPAGVPLGVNALDVRPVPPEAPFAFYGAAVHTLELTYLRDLAEYFPQLVADEARAEASRARGEIDVAQFVAQSRPDHPVYIATRGRLIAEIEAKAGRKLVEVARRGRDRQAVVLLRTP